MLALTLAALSGCTRTQRFLLYSDANTEPRSYPAQITRPASTPRGAILLIGGGYGHDEHWTVPASYTVEGVTTPLTIEGRAHQDARILTQHLVARGYTVMQQSMIHTNDPNYPENIALAGGMGVPESVTLYADAVAEFRKREPHAQAGLILIGHSLGAIRTARLADEGTAAIVWLAPAYATPAAAPDSQELPLLGGPWPIESIRALDLPLLALFGDSDTHTMHAEPLRSATRVSVTVYNGLGHNLAPEVAGRVGPIDERIPQDIADWLDGLLRAP